MAEKRQNGLGGAEGGVGTGEIVIYQGETGAPTLEVRLEADTIWLSQRQMAELFEKNTDTIGLHIRNIYEEGELDERATTEDSSVVQREGSRTVRRTLRLYNLDAVISVGYRVNSKRGTQFRIWATQVLREHILRGYSVNERRLQELRQSIRLVGQVLDRHDVTSDEAKALLHVVTDYSRASKEKAAHLLYFVVKNHSFVDGNKRIAAALFLWFLETNGMLYRPDGTKRIADTTLVAVTLLIAESEPRQKDVLTVIVANLIADGV